MKLNKSICKLIAELEYRIGSECYNPNSYDGWNCIDGCDFRYPVSFPDTNGDYIKVRGNICSSSLVNEKGVNKNTVPYMKYKFGSNELYIGTGIIKVLEYLEKRYDLDFVELEKMSKGKKRDSKNSK